MNGDDENLLDLPALKDAPIGVAHGISALALNFALKWHDMRLIKDGALYQQKKLEGVNFQLIDLPDVFAAAAEFERHILNAPNRLSEIVLEAVGEAFEEVFDEEREEAASTPDAGA